MTEQNSSSGTRPLPLIRRVRIQHLSLYQNRRIIDVPVGPGVFCLAGANGLGKSTFLATINFGITGVVADPERSFRSVPEYYQDSLDHAKNFFDGRVSKLDRDTAEVEVEFSVGPNVYSVTRGLFSLRALRKLQVRNGKEVIVDGSIFETETDRQSQYERQILADMRLQGFDQLSFLQHFVLTFDERRHLIFWNPQVAEQALYLAFGVNAELAAAADGLRRRAERAESQARNLQYQSTVARNRLRELHAAVEGEEVTSTNASLLVQHENLVENQARMALLARQARDRVADAKLSVARAASAYQVVQRSYDEAFQTRIRIQRDPAKHPLIRSLRANHECNVCGSVGDHVADHAEAAAQSGRCPVCDSNLQERGTPQTSMSADLSGLDNELSNARKNLAALQDDQKRLEAEASQALADADSAEDALSSLESQNEEALSKATDASNSSALTGLMRSLEIERADAMRRRDEFREVRDKAREEVKPVQEALAKAYENAELRFVPSFRELARSFLGLDLDIYLSRRESAGFELLLDVESQRRRRTTQLSESQRFFVDIALRMALAQFMAGPNAPATLYIDTPEGSLDIAYEARAGDMFARFVRAGNQLLMTANINSSRLLLELAEKTPADRMDLVRMTDWTPLSDVQSGAEEAFDSAFAAIEEKRTHQSERGE